MRPYDMDSLVLHGGRCGYLRESWPMPGDQTIPATKLTTLALSNEEC